MNGYQTIKSDSRGSRTGKRPTAGSGWNVRRLKQPDDNGHGSVDLKATLAEELDHGLYPGFVGAGEVLVHRHRDPGLQDLHMCEVVLLADLVRECVVVRQVRE